MRRFVRELFLLPAMTERCRPMKKGGSAITDIYNIYNIYPFLKMPARPVFMRVSGKTQSGNFSNLGWQFLEPKVAISRTRGKFKQLRYQLHENPANGDWVSFFRSSGLRNSFSGDSSGSVWRGTAGAVLAKCREHLSRDVKIVIGGRSKPVEAVVSAKRWNYPLRG